MEDSLEITVEAERKPSRPWLTAFLSLTTCGVYLFVQTMALGVMCFIASRTHEDWDALAWLEQADTNGFVIAVCTLCAAIVVVPLVIVFSRLLRPDASKDYLGLRLLETKEMLGWIALAIAFVGVADGLTWLLGREVVPSFMREATLTAGPPPWLWIALLIAAPVCEELIFRGLLFQGLISTRLKLIGTSIVTSLAWASLHIQYDLYGIGTIFVLGILLTVVRYTSKSIIPCICMHSVMNLVATIEAVWVVSAL